MQRFFIVYIITFFLTGVSLAGAAPGNTITGQVKDNDGKPLMGAVIEIPDLKLGTVSDSAGYYSLNDLPKGKFAVVASLISYSKVTVFLSISGSVTQNFVLLESAIESHEVVITGQSRATEIKRSPVPVAVINNEYLRTNISSNIIDAIAKVPGVSAVSTGPNVSKPVIRGLGFNRVLTLYNGMRLEGQQWGDEHGIEVDEYNVEKIEVIKGPSSLIYGSDALAGVVNLIPTRPAPDGKIAGEVALEGQSNNGMAGLSGMLSGNKKGLFWLARVSGKMARDYENPVDGKVYGTNFRETDASGAVGVNKKWGFSHLEFTLFDDLQAIPDGSRDSATREFTKQISDSDTYRPIVSNGDLNSYAIPVVHQHVQQYRVLSSNSFNVLGGQFIVNAGFERSVRREYSYPQAPETAGLYLQLNTYTYDLRYHLQSLEGWDVSAGANGMYQVNDVTRGTDFIIPSYRQFDIGPFVVFEKKFEKLSIAGGLRYDVRNFAGDALYRTKDMVTGYDRFAGTSSTSNQDTMVFSKINRAFSGTTYSIGAAYVFSKRLALKVNLARGYRAPNIVEISANGVHPGTYLYQLGNEHFKPEFSLQEDIGLEFTSQHLSVNVSVFNNDISNYIFNKKLTGSNGLDSFIQDNPVYQFTQTAARLYGGELDIDIHPHPLDWLHFENGISVVYAENKGGNGVRLTDSEKYLPLIPPLHFTSELRASFKQVSKTLRNSFFKVQVLYYATQDRVYLADNTESNTSGYTLFNAGAGTDVCGKKGKVMFNISVFGNNLFDAAYQDHLSRPKYFESYPNDPRGRSGIYNMGRNIGLKVSVPIGS